VAHLDGSFGGLLKVSVDPTAAGLLVLTRPNGRKCPWLYGTEIVTIIYVSYLADRRIESMRTVMNRNTIGVLLALVLMVISIAPSGLAYGQRWHNYWHPYNHVSTGKGALIGGVGGAGIGALAGGWKGALIGGGLGAGAGYLVQRYRNNHRSYGYYSYYPYGYYSYYPYGYYPYRHYRYYYRY